MAVFIEENELRAELEQVKKIKSRCDKFIMCHAVREEETNITGEAVLSERH